MNRKTARSVLCIVLVLILVLSLVSVLAPVRAGSDRGDGELCRS